MNGRKANGALEDNTGLKRLINMEKGTVFGRTASSWGSLFHLQNSDI